MHTVTPVRVILALVFYLALWVVISTDKRGIDQYEKRTFLVVGWTLALTVFAANYLLYRAGVMSFLPWVNNALHTFVWIGICLTWLYLATWERNGPVRLFVLFATFSLVVKYAEQLLFGTWEHDHFFFVFRGNFAYVVGWSAADGLLPFVIRLGLRLLERLGVRGLVSV